MTLNDLKMSMLYLDEADTVEAGALNMIECVDVLEEMFSLLDIGDYRMSGQNLNSHGAMLTFPETSEIPGMPTSGDDRRFMAMPAYLGGRFHLAGMKWYGSNVENRRRGLPRSIHLIVLNDVDTGAPIAIMTGNLISAIRTGAVGGVAARYLAREDARTVSIVGPGVMGRTALQGFMAARPRIDTLKIKGRGERSTRAFIEYVREAFPDITTITVCDTLESAVADADIVSYCTTGSTGASNYPLLERAWLKPGAFLSMPSYLRVDPALETPEINKVVDNMKLYEAWGMELPAPHHDAIGAIGCRFVDLIEEGKLDKRDVTDLGAIVNDPLQGRHTDDEIILFSIGGMPVEDVAWASQVFQNASSRGIGTSLPLWDSPLLS